MKVKITTISGNVYNIEEELLTTNRAGGEFNIYSYSKFNDYYAGMGKYRDKKLLLTINDSRIEAIDFRKVEYNIDLSKV